MQGCKRHGFDPWVGKIPWRRAWQPTPVFLSGKSHVQRSVESYKSIGSQRVRHNRRDLASTHAEELQMPFQNVDFWFSPRTSQLGISGAWGLGTSLTASPYSTWLWRALRPLLVGKFYPCQFCSVSYILLIKMSIHKTHSVAFFSKPSLHLIIVYDYFC